MYDSACVFGCRCVCGCRFVGVDAGFRVDVCVCVCVSVCVCELRGLNGGVCLEVCVCIDEDVFVQEEMKGYTYVYTCVDGCSRVYACRCILVGVCLWVCAEEGL